MNMGTFYAGALAINKDPYNKLPPEVQKVVREVGREYTAKVAEGVDRAFSGLKVFKEQTNPAGGDLRTARRTNASRCSRRCPTSPRAG